MSITKEQLTAGIKALAAIAEAIRELGTVPSGTLYAQLMGKLDMPTYSAMIETLKRAGLVAETNHELRWVGGAI